jgi:hypothetical protein
MQQGSGGDRSTPLFWGVLGLGAAFVWFSSAGLPATVASHFGPDGRVNGFLPQSAYRLFMLGLVAGIPALLYLLPKLLLRLPTELINLPHRDYWMADSRRADSVAYLAWHAAWFAPLVMLFLCYVHWLVVLANRDTPPHLAQGAMFAGLLALLAVAGFWMWLLIRHFNRVP